MAADTLQFFFSLSRDENLARGLANVTGSSSAPFGFRHPDRRELLGVRELTAAQLSGNGIAQSDIVLVRIAARACGREVEPHVRKDEIGRYAEAFVVGK